MSLWFSFCVKILNSKSMFLGKEYVKAIYCHRAYLASMQSTS